MPRSATFLSLALLCALLPFVVHAQCSSAATCGQCESLSAGLNCGWCSTTNVCSTGNINGPTLGSCTNNWSFQSCPSDIVCTTQSNCESCLQHSSACFYCMDNNSCQPGATGPIPGASCSQPLTGVSSNCPVVGPSNSYPGAGSAAIVMLVIVSLLLLLRLFLYCDYTRGSRQAAPLLLAGAALILKLTALGVDRWDVLDLQIDGNTNVNFPSVYWGLLQYRYSSLPSGASAPSHMSYKEFCDSFTPANDHTADQANNLGTCRTLRAAGIMALVSGIGACVASALLVLYGLALLGGHTTLVKRGVWAWRIAGFGNMLSLACFCYWITSAHVVINWLVDTGDLWVGPSYFCCFCAWLCDFVLLLFMRRAISSTPNPAQGEFVVVQPAPYAILGGAGAGIYVAQQPSAPGYAQPQQMGYGGYQQQPYQPQPAYAPGAVATPVYPQIVQQQPYAVQPPQAQQQQRSQRPEGQTY